MHNGDPVAARKLAQKNIDAFLDSGAEYVVVNSAGCGSAMKEYGELFADDRGVRRQGRSASPRACATSASCWSSAASKRRPAPLDAKVTYQDSCHLVHAQRIREAPRQVMRAIPGLELAEMATPDRCCGSAGIYNITQTEMSRRLLDDKMDDCLSTGCDVLATANPGCMLQLELGVKLRGGDQRVMHVVELLDEAYRARRSRVN